MADYVTPMAVESTITPVLAVLLVLGVLLTIILAILAFVFWIFMLIDAAKRNFKADSDKIIWVLIIVFLGIIGAIVYYFVIKREDKK